MVTQIKTTLDLKLINQIFSEPQEIIGKDRFFNSAVLVTLVLVNHEYHFLFEKRSAKIRQGGEVSFPGGEFDINIDKTFQDTAIRETVEELGIGKDTIDLLGKMGTLVAPMGITVDPYIAVLNISSLEQLRIETDEVEKVFTIPVSFFLQNKPDTYFINVRAHPSEVDDNGNKVELLPVKKLGLPKRYGDPWRKARHRVLVYNYQGEIVWGMTAEIVNEFCKHIVDREK